jgi:hypothetical protein
MRKLRASLERESVVHAVPWYWQRELARRRGQSDQVEIDAAKQRGFTGVLAGAQPRELQFGEDEAVDVRSDPVRLFGLGRLACLWFSECPVFAGFFQIDFFFQSLAGFSSLRAVGPVASEKGNFICTQVDKLLISLV